MSAFVSLILELESESPLFEAAKHDDEEVGAGLRVNLIRPKDGAPSHQ